jgi:hypothetical protein
MDIDNTAANRAMSAKRARTRFLHPARRDSQPVAAAGLFSGTSTGTPDRESETKMNETRAMNSSHSSLSALRAAVLAAAVALALAVGVPWLLTDAPPSAEAAFVSRLCCSAPVAAPAPAQVRTLAPGR